MARATKRMCRDCGFMTPLAGALGVMFGVCCNAMAADGQVVDFTYGCGAHSDTPAPPAIGSPLYEPYDDGVLEVVEAVPVLVEAPPDLETPRDLETPPDLETPSDPVKETEVPESSPVESGTTQIAEIPEPLEVSEAEPTEG